MIPKSIEAHNYLELDNLKYPEHLIKLPKREWPNPAQADEIGLVEAWRSRHFLVQVYKATVDAQRVTVNRTTIDGKGRWKDGITWDELQEIKRQIGRGDSFAVEIFPADDKIVNVGNLRHLWILPAALSFAWGEK